ncbi:MAG: hypothetical protein WAL99_01415 [Pseudonocardiaceae bacterium]
MDHEHRAALLADYLREQARWREIKAEEYPEDARNARSARALLDAAEYVAQLPDDDQRLVRLDRACRYTELGIFAGGEEVGHVVRLHHFHGPTGSPSQFLDDLAGAAEKDDATL